MAQAKASQLLRNISMSDICGEDIESNVVSAIGANCTSAFATMVHLVMIKSSEVVVFGFLQKILTSSVKVMKYSQTATTVYIISTHMLMHMA